MAATNTTATLAGFFKQVYGDDVKALVPSLAILSKRIPFLQSEMLGDYFNLPVDLSAENGVTYYTSANEGSTTLLAANAGQMKNAQVQGSNMVARSRIGYAALASAAAANDVKSFGKASAWVVKRLAASLIKRLEIQLLHGQKGLGVVASYGTTTATTAVCVISDEQWAAGIWAGSEGATLDAYAAADLATKLNPTGALTITAVDVPNKSITISGAAGDITAVIGAASTTFFWETASAATEFAGLDKILRNTGSLFGIDAASYSLWASNVYSTTTGTPSMAKINAAVSMTASFGNSKDVIAVVSPKVFEILNSDQAAQRLYDSSYDPSQAQNGMKGIKFYGQTGVIEIVPDLFQKDGLIHIFPPEEAHRPGATDCTFLKRFGDASESLILENADSPSSEMRAQSNQALLLEAPRHAVVMAGVTV